VKFLSRKAADEENRGFHGQIGGKVNGAGKLDGLQQITASGCKPIPDQQRQNSRHKGSQQACYRATDRVDKMPFKAASSP
jgi:hypothetical protein